MRGLSDEQTGLTLDGIPTGDSRFNGGSPPARFIESSNVGKITVSQSAGDIGAPSHFALGGFIDFVTDAPRKDFGMMVEGGAGSFNFTRLYGRIDTGEILPGLTSYFTYSTQKNDVWAGRDNRHSRREHYEFKAVKAFDNGSTIQARVSYNDQTDNDFNIVTKGEFLAAPRHATPRHATPRSDRALDALTGIPARDIDFGGALGGTRKDWLAYVNGSFKLSEKITLSINPYYQTLEGQSFRYQDRQRILTGGDPRVVTSYNANGSAVRPTLTTQRNSNAVGGPADMRVTPRDRDRDRDRERYGVTSEMKADDLFPGHSFRAGATAPPTRTGATSIAISPARRAPTRFRCGPASDGETRGPSLPLSEAFVGAGHKVRLAFLTRNVKPFTCFAANGTDAWPGTIRRKAIGRTTMPGGARR
ncbi:hypothetical protein [Caulobacter sp. DWR1-3-2b1]|uniref:hypothetical protein n=1 Tax=Caulobacter sp. DWR1-3-2b1 TaxID=2804670 RepID=UPI003CE8CF07